MITCKCGRKLKENTICLCSHKGESEIVYSYKNTEIKNIETASNIEEANNIFTINNFHLLWKELHTYEIKNSERNDEWFNGFTQKIPCGECKKHWLDMIKEYPPDFSNQKAYFEWSVKVHNIVNKRLGKKEISVEEALSIWF